MRNKIACLLLILLASLLACTESADLTTTDSTDLDARRLWEIVRDDDMEQLQTVIKQEPELVDTAFFYAAYDCKTDTVAILLDAGANPDIELVDGMALHRAALHDDVELARLLIDAGANVDALDWYWGTPLEEARKWNSKEVASLLLASGATDPMLMCPNGHTNVKELPVFCGRWLSQEQRDMVDRGEAIWGGRFSPPSYVVCQECNFQYDTYYRRWETDNRDGKELAWPLPELIANAPIPEGVTPRYRITIRHGHLTEASVVFSPPTGATETRRGLAEYLKANKGRLRVYIRERRPDEGAYVRLAVEYKNRFDSERRY
jgi:hypothetical protein